jgi:two-component system, OmpR family, response regulator
VHGFPLLLHRLIMRALIVEDDPTMVLLVRQLLEDDGYVVDEAGTAEQARATLADAPEHDAMVVDLMLPDGHGLALIEELRRAGRSTPVIVLTGSDETGATVRALDAGADDYLRKPVDPDEFRARMRALVRRGGAQRLEQLVVSNVSLNRLRRVVHVSGAALHLTPRELALLEHLMLRVGQVVSRQELLHRVWAMDFDPGTNVVDVNVTRLRKKLEQAGSAVVIQGRRGQGFALVGPLA